jgi:hypothetical protein
MPSQGDNQMTAKLPFEIGVSLSPEQVAALNMATECLGTGTSQYVRQALMERLIREQFLQHPAAKFAANNVSK